MKQVKIGSYDVREGYINQFVNLTKSVKDGKIPFKAVDDMIETLWMAVCPLSQLVKK